MDMELLIERIENAVGDLGIEQEDVAKVDERIEAVSEIVGRVVPVVKDGLQWSDLGVIGEVVPDVMRLAASFDDYEGEDKKRFVVNLVWTIYRIVDTFPDGKRNNIDLPLAMGFLERRIERAVVSFAAGMAVEAAFKRMRKDGEV